MARVRRWNDLEHPIEVLAKELHEVQLEAVPKDRNRSTLQPREVGANFRLREEPRSVAGRVERLPPVFIDPVARIGDKPSLQVRIVARASSESSSSPIDSTVETVARHPGG